MHSCGCFYRSRHRRSRHECTFLRVQSPTFNKRLQRGFPVPQGGSRAPKPDIPVQSAQVGVISSVSDRSVYDFGLSQCPLGRPGIKLASWSPTVKMSNGPPKQE